MIASIVGLMNSGKTLFMTYKLLIEYLKGKDILTNYYLNFPKIKNCGRIFLINQDYLFSVGQKGLMLKNVAIGIDELWIFAMDSRSSMGKFQKIMTYFFLQSSKDDTQIYFTAQNNNQNDIRLRSNMHKIYICDRVLKINNKFVKINDEKRFLNSDEQNNLFIHSQEYKIKNIGFQNVATKNSEIYIKANLYFNLYDTTQKIKALQNENN